MEHPCPFVVLDTVDSTNNYAMSMVRNTSPEPGTAWFSPNQTAGKGQRGKSWQTAPGMAISLSIALVPVRPFRADRFHLSALAGISCIRFLEKYVSGGLTLKWPNDLYWRDRKAGGILIENLITGSDWKWTVVGIGINLNQLNFPAPLAGAVSIRMISGTDHDTEQLARELHKQIVADYSAHTSADEIMRSYNNLLFKKGEVVQLQQGDQVFRCRIIEVDETGRLHTEGEGPGVFSVGEVSWI